MHNVLNTSTGPFSTNTIIDFKSTLLVGTRSADASEGAERNLRTFVSGGRRDGGRGTSDGGKVDACLGRE